MDTIELTQEQHDIYVFAMEQSPLSADASLKNFKFDEAVTDDHVIAYARMGSEDQNAWGILALPEISTKVFLGITDADPESFSQVISGFEAESEVNDSIGFGHVAPVDSTYYNQAGWAGVLMARVSELVDGFPESGSLNGEIYDFHLVVPITKEELSFGRRKGGLALVEKMHHNQRDFFSFHQTPLFDENATPQQSKATPIVPSTSTTSSTTTSSSSSTTIAAKTSAPVRSTTSVNNDVEAIPPPPTTLSDDELPNFEDMEPKETIVKSAVSKMADQLRDTDLHDEMSQSYEKIIQNKLNSLRYWHVNKQNQVMGETAIGTLLLVGGAFLSGRLYSGSYGILAIFTGVFSVAGLIILYNAYKDSQSIHE